MIYQVTETLKGGFVANLLGNPFPEKEGDRFAISADQFIANIISGAWVITEPVEMKKPERIFPKTSLTVSQLISICRDSLFEEVEINIANAAIKRHILDEEKNHSDDITGLVRAAIKRKWRGVI
jgi:hypothetical protein